LGYLYSMYGGAKNYLTDAGTDGEILNHIIQNFCG